jgi:hypothetical protein
MDSVQHNFIVTVEINYTFEEYYIVKCVAL